MNGYWYMDGGDGRRFCWAKDPTFRCPIGTAERLGDLFEAACEEAGIDKTWMLHRLKHSSHRKRVDGKLTDRCDSCGHRLERVGFRCWIARDLTDDAAAQRVAERLGFRGPSETLKSFYMDTKREAQAWAREEAAISKSAQKESDR